MLGADGARESGLTALMYATIANFAVDAVLAVSLAGTLFFSATTGESKGSVAAYLLVTIAPFAVLAPVIGPLLDRIRTGRRIAMSLTFAARVILAAVLL
ncbi:MAG: MFS transporter, partial [Corynebacterium variabile]|nr:MFS transporter [Corynebacterium variabile]